jgi:murein DD-endopeptidase MepM/ murein hydrolase activator NlpD
MGVVVATATSVAAAGAALAVLMAPPTTAAPLPAPSTAAAPSRGVPPPPGGAASRVTPDAPAMPDTTAASAPGRGPPDEGDASVEPRYAWPLLPPPAVLAPFGAPEDPFGPGHRGVDLAGAIGQPVLAARGGTVAFAGPVAGHGVVSVQHDDGLRTTYEPLVPSVHGGDVVNAGAVLGTLVAGHRGCSAPCLHWGVRRDRLEYLDPLVLLRPLRVRLLPVPEPWPDP